MVAISALGAGLDVVWSAPADCPDGAALSAAVHARLDDAFLTTPASVRGEVRGTAGAWTLDLEVRTNADVDVRRVEDADCTTLTEAAALIIALTIERSVVPPPPSEPESRSTEIPPPTTTPTPTPTGSIDASPRRPPARVDALAPAPKPAPAPQRALRWGARASAGVSIGPLPNVGADVEAAALLQRRRFIAELGARYEPPRRARYPDAPDLGGSLSLWAIGGALCFAPAAGRVRFPICGGAEAGGMYGRGFGLPVNRKAHVPWAAARASAAVSIAVLPRLRLFARAEFVAPLWRAGFTTDSRGPVHQAAPLGGRIHLGLEFIRS